MTTLATVSFAVLRCKRQPSARNEMTFQIPHSITEEKPSEPGETSPSWQRISLTEGIYFSNFSFIHQADNQFLSQSSTSEVFGKDLPTSGEYLKCRYLPSGHNRCIVLRANLRKSCRG